ncbi:MAG TPA: protein kinase, partial [Kofleriaceae bacterium]|nr:protein kinase [Kofleriaceae bacterium]
MIGDDDTVAHPTPAVTGTSKAFEGSEVIAGRYQLRGWLGSGGMGTVYRADDTELGETVALKVLKPALVGDPAALERFRREVKLARRVAHKNVARMFDIGEHAGAKFLTMELVEGESLSRRMEQGPMSAGRIVAIGTELCDGLAAAHAAGVVHRDLKPDNILLANDGRVVITDFGIARAAAASAADPRATGVAVVIGTPAYMAPEQLDGRQDLDGRADLFALGVILYELATGEKPWTGSSPVSIALAQSKAPRPDPRAVRADVPAPLAIAIRRCLDPDPAQRYATATALAHELGLAAAPSSDWTGPGMAPMPRAREASLAVLPFRRTPDDDYLAEGLVEDVIDTLSMTEGLRVRPLGAVAKLDPAGDPRELGRTLEVEHVIEGSLRRTPAGLRITTRLVHVGDGFQVWAQRTDCAADAVLEVGAAIARGVAEALSTRAAQRVQPTDPRVVDLYLRARHEMRKFWREGLVTAAELLEQAKRLAPDSPTVLATLAYVRVRLWSVSAQPALAPAAREAAAAAIAIAPDLGEARLARALIEINTGDLELAAVDLGYAVRRAMSLPEAHMQAAFLCVECGDIDEARARFASAIQIDPGQRPQVECELARVDALDGALEAAEARVARAAEGEEPSLQRMASFYQARFRMWHGDLSGAARRAEVSVGPDRPGIYGMFFAELARDGLVDTSWKTWFERLTIEGAALRGRLFAAQILSEVALGYGRLDLARQSLSWAVDHGFKDLYWWDHCPLVQRIDDPEIRALR